MKKNEIVSVLRKAIEEKGVCRMYLFYEDAYRYLFPIAMSDKYFMYVEENDFLMNGVYIRPISDVEEIERNTSKAGEIAIEESGIKSYKVPDIDITSFKSALEGLCAIGDNVIIECESAEEYEYAFNIGRIEKVMEDKVRLRHFDADAVWEKKPRDIPYKRITSISFDTRYIEVFSKYLPEL